MLEVCTAIIGSNRCARLMRQASTASLKSSPGASKAHGRPASANDRLASSVRNSIRFEAQRRYATLVALVGL